MAQFLIPSRMLWKDEVQRKRAEKSAYDSTDLLRELRRDAPELRKAPSSKEAEVLQRLANASGGKNHNISPCTSGSTGCVLSCRQIRFLLGNRYFMKANILHHRPDNG